MFKDILFSYNQTLYLQQQEAYWHIYASMYWVIIGSLNGLDQCWFIVNWTVTYSSTIQISIHKLSLNIAIEIAETCLEYIGYNKKILDE